MSDDERMVLYEPEGRIAYITFNRTEILNALSGPALLQLDEALERGRDDPEVRVLILRGNGRAFSAGADFTGPGNASAEVVEEDVVDDQAKLERSVDRYLRIWNHPKPIIAQVHGYCLGIATQICVVCDITVVAEDARIGFPSIPVGGGYISPMWTWLVGPKRAKEMSFTVGSQISGTTAAEWGWANRAVPADQLEETVRQMAERIANVPSKILRIKKLGVNRTMDVRGFSTAIRFGQEFDAMLHYSEPVKVMQKAMRERGMREGIDAFNRGEFS